MVDTSGLEADRHQRSYAMHNSLEPNPNIFPPVSVRMSDADIIAINLAGVESHFHAEDTGSVSAALEAFTDDCVWEAPNPIGLNKRLVGKAELGPFYKKLFTTMKDVQFRIC